MALFSATKLIMFARLSTVILYAAALLVSTVTADAVPPDGFHTITTNFGHVSLAPHQNLIMLISWYNLFRIILYLGHRCQTLSALASEPV
jgi:hypothetical protein